MTEPTDQARRRDPPRGGRAFSAADLARWSGGTWSGPPAGSVTGVGHDTRTLQSGQLYVALAGERHDGHAFVDDALARGAAAALVNERYRPREGGARALLTVPDTGAALLAIAAGYRNSLAAEILGVTGSVGKTTVKEMTADVLSVLGPVARTPGNWNNDVGMPLSLLAAPRDAAFGVFEVGMNHPGELARLGRVLKPGWVLMTTVGPAHLEFFASVEEIAREKATLLESLPPDGVSVLNRDEPWFELFRQASPGRVVAVSMESEADYVGRPAGAGATCLRVEERATGLVADYEMPLPGDYVMKNALLAIAVGREHGVAPGPIARALAAFRPLSMRWRSERVGGLLVVNDAYNANPISMRAALNAFRRVKTPGARWLLFAGMFELGEAEEEEHRALGREVAYGGWGGLIVVGRLGALIAEGAVSEGLAAERVERCADTRAAAAAVRRRCRPGDAVLIKASRGEHLEDVVKHLEGNSDA